MFRIDQRIQPPPPLLTGDLNTDLSEIVTNLVPFPSLHFLLPALAPLSTPLDRRYASSRLETLCTEALAPPAQLVGVDPRKVFYFSTQTPISPICRTPLFPISQN